MLEKIGRDEHGSVVQVADSATAPDVVGAPNAAAEASTAMDADAPTTADKLAAGEEVSKVAAGEEMSKVVEADGKAAEGKATEDEGKATEANDKGVEGDGKVADGDDKVAADETVTKLAANEEQGDDRGTAVDDASSVVAVEDGDELFQTTPGGLSAPVADAIEEQVPMTAAQYTSIIMRVQ